MKLSELVAKMEDGYTLEYNNPQNIDTVYEDDESMKMYLWISVYSGKQWLELSGFGSGNTRPEKMLNDVLMNPQNWKVGPKADLYPWSSTSDYSIQRHKARTRAYKIDNLR